MKYLLDAMGIPTFVGQGEDLGHRELAMQGLQHVPGPSRLQRRCEQHEKMRKQNTRNHENSKNCDELGIVEFYTIGILYFT